MENIDRNMHEYPEMKLFAKNTIEQHHDYKIVNEKFESVVKNIL